MKRYDCAGGSLHFYMIKTAFEAAFPYGDRDSGKLIIATDAEPAFRSKFIDPENVKQLWHLPIEFSDELKTTMKFYNFDRPAHSAEIVNFNG